MTADELREALSTEGTSLADVAAEQGVETADLVDDLVAAATERVRQGVDDGRLSAERADEVIAELPDRVAEAVEQDASELQRGGPGGHGRGGPGHDRTDGTTGP